MLFSQRPKSYIVFLLDSCRGCWLNSISNGVCGWILDLHYADCCQSQESRFQYVKTTWNEMLESMSCGLTGITPRLLLSDLFIKAPGFVSVGCPSTPAAPFPGELPWEDKNAYKVVCFLVPPAIHSQWMIDNRLQNIARWDNSVM